MRPGRAIILDERHHHLRRKQQGEGVVIWAGIIRDRLVRLIRVPKEVKVTPIAYCNLPKESLVPWLNYIPLSLLRDFVFMHDNAPSNFARATKAFLASLGIRGDKFMWPLCSAI